MATSGLCRNCGESVATADHIQRCPTCGSRRLLYHDELHDLSIAHIDCDAFFASVEKRDHPEWRDRPLIVGGAHRGVVAAACYLARVSGVRSAMPMFKARKLCPRAVVVPPDMARYRQAGQAVRRIMSDYTPLVEPLSIDEAFLDLSGTARLHRGSPAHTLVMLIKRIEREVGVTASVGLSHNKLLAKMASDLDKPRGFAVIGRAQTLDFLAPLPVAALWGVGAALGRRLARDSITTVGQLRDYTKRQLAERYGVMGERLFQFCRGEDPRTIQPERETKSLSCEITLDRDLRHLDALKEHLWPLCEKLAARLKAAGFLSDGIVLKLKTADFRLITRSRRLPQTSRLADDLYEVALPLLKAEADGRPFRLIGIGAAPLRPDSERPAQNELLNAEHHHREQVADAVDAVRARFGPSALVRGRAYTNPRTHKPNR